MNIDFRRLADSGRASRTAQMMGPVTEIISMPDADFAAYAEWKLAQPGGPDAWRESARILRLYREHVAGQLAAIDAALARNEAAIKERH
jgi:hypothetical protein